MIEYDDVDLKKSFGALRREAAAGAASFQTTLAAAQARRLPAQRRRRLRLAAAAIGVTAALAFLLARRGQPRGGSVGIDLASVRWHAPTDFLLKLPGDELLRRVPRLGRLNLDRRTL